MNRKPIAKVTLKLKKAAVAGRIISVRKMKNFSFCDIADISGSIQLVINSSTKIQSPAIGDIVVADGEPFRTKSGQLSLKCAGLEILSKGSKDVSNAISKPSANSKDVRSQRSLELMASSELRKMVVARSLFINIVRDCFRKNDFLEVDTPVLSHARFAGTADVFETKSQSLGRNLYLRGTLEDYLKQLIVAGFEKVFQIGDCFRNESPSLIEFTMLEATWAYGKSGQMLKIVQDIIHALCEQLPDSLVDSTVKKELSKEFVVTPFWEVLAGHFKADIRTLNPDKIKKLAREAGYIFPDSKHYDYELSKFGYDVIKRTLSKEFESPTFVSRFPSNISPLAKEINDGSGEADRGYGFFHGQRLFEVVAEADSYEEQLKKFQDQDDRSHQRAHSFKHDDLLTALSYGCPPMAGLGFNINRILAVLLNVNRTSEVMAFPITSAPLPL
jgi:lysyl-tRNA synthetase, class II